MYSVIACAVIGLILSIIFTSFCHYKEYIMNGVLSIVIGVIVGVVISVAIMACVPNDTVSYTETYEIVSINDNTGTSGWYMAMTPSMSYAMYIKFGDGYKLITQSSNAKIMFSRNNPRIEYIHKKRVFDWVDNFKFKSLMWTDRVSNVVIYVPENSIKKDFLLDAK